MKAQLARKPQRRSSPVSALAKSKLYSHSSAPSGLAETIASIRKGLPLSAFDELAALLGLTQEAFAKSIGISVPTISRRRLAGQNLDPEHSDRLLRFRRIYDLAVALFEGDAQSAKAWLNAPAPALGRATPLAMADTETGAEAVKALIGRLEFGELT